MAARTDIVTDGHFIAPPPPPLPLKRYEAANYICVRSGLEALTSSEERLVHSGHLSLLHSRLVRLRSQFTLYAC